MMREMRIGIAVGAVFTAVICLGLFQWQVEATKRTHGLYADSLEASRDTTRRVLLATNVLASNVHLVQRRALQVQLRADSLDRALKLKRAARADLVARADPVSVAQTAVTTADSTDSLDTRHVLVTAMRKAPFSIDSVTVDAPRPPAAALVAIWNLRLDSIPMGFRLHCGSKNAQGIRTAFVNVTGPAWLKIDLQHVEQLPEVCNPTPRSWRASWTSLGGLRDRLGVFVGVGLDGHGRAIAGLKAWP